LAAEVSRNGCQGAAKYVLEYQGSEGRQSGKGGSFLQWQTREKNAIKDQGLEIILNAGDINEVLRNEKRSQTLTI